MIVQRDELGRIKRLVEVAGTVTRNLAYSYDAAGRLSEVARDGTATRFLYDNNGNRSSVRVDGNEIAAAEYDAQDRIQAFGDMTFEQTENGELLRRTQGSNALELTYDGLGNLLTAVAATATTTKTIDYTIDGLGRRVGKQVGGKFSRAWLYRDIATISVPSRKSLTAASSATSSTPATRPVRPTSCSARGWRFASSRITWARCASSLTPPPASSPKRSSMTSSGT